MRSSKEGGVQKRGESSPPSLPPPRGAISRDSRAGHCPPRDPSTGFSILEPSEAWACRGLWGRECLRLFFFIARHVGPRQKGTEEEEEEEEGDEKLHKHNNSEEET
ncbi:unnamed protein product [Prorocentrum cordatum]|uniref:Uncharacterized protein n=1 Tax=Prorocentrum cordatum TaxID=2364126 RepID=A0ABN9PPI7_9DINO|nr:unnamed protein product [Polarella glacialis]